MNAELKEAKQDIRAFMREHYSDARLVELLQHAREGKLSYISCCCFIGIVTATHALQDAHGNDMAHTRQARGLPLAREAENGFLLLGNVKGRWDNDVRHSEGAARRRIIPIILAEIRRRERLRAQDNIFTSATGDAMVAPESLLQP